MQGISGKGHREVAEASKRWQVLQKGSLKRESIALSPSELRCVCGTNSVVYAGVWFVDCESRDGSQSVVPTRDRVWHVTLLGIL